LSYFAVIEPVIRRYEKLTRTIVGKAFVAVAQLQFGDLQKNYYSALYNPNYGSVPKKFAYLFKYAVPHGYYVYVALRSAGAPVTSILAAPVSRVACIGGGPGSEIIGLHRYLEYRGLNNAGRTLAIDIYDKEPSWDAVCAELVAELPFKVEIEINFYALDATDPSSYEKIDFSEYDIVISSFFLSETRKLKIATACRKFWRHLLNTMREGSILLVLDYADSDGRNRQYLASVLNEHETEDICTEDSVEMWCPDSKDCIEDLAVEFDHRPKKKGTNFYRICRMK
jgi:hypothetical protein